MSTDCRRAVYDFSCNDFCPASCDDVNCVLTSVSSCTLSLRSAPGSVETAETPALPLRQSGEEYYHLTWSQFVLMSSQKLMICFNDSAFCMIFDVSTVFLVMLLLYIFFTIALCLADLCLCNISGVSKVFWVWRNPCWCRSRQPTRGGKRTD